MKIWQGLLRHGKQFHFCTRGCCNALKYSLISNLTSTLEERCMWAETQTDKKSLHLYLKIQRGLNYSVISSLSSVLEDTTGPEVISDKQL